MILKGAQALRFFSHPDPKVAGILIHGPDTMRVALRRQDVVLALIGPAGADEMRLTRLSGAALRKEPSGLIDGMRAMGFFPGPRVVLVEEATDGLAPLFAEALAQRQAGDAQVMATAGQLTGKSALKALFDARPDCVSAALYDDPPSPAEIAEALGKAGLTSIDPTAMADLDALARSIEPGDFRQLLEKIALFKHRDLGPLTAAEVASLAPLTVEADVDDLIAAVADGRHADIGLMMRRLEGQGIAPVTLCIAALRHFRLLHQALSDPGGPGSGVQGLRMPMRGKDALLRQARTWSLPAVEQAMAQLVETDLTLRSSSRVPSMALTERMLLRIAMTFQQRSGRDMPARG